MRLMLRVLQLSLLGCCLPLVMSCALVGGDDDDDFAPVLYEGDELGECTDRADNDRDGLFDCDDPGCEGSPDCTGTGDDDDDTTPPPATHTT